MNMACAKRLSMMLKRGSKQRVFNADFPSAKDEIIQTNGELRWRDKAGRAASKSMRLSSILRSHAQTSTRRDSKRNGCIGKALDSVNDRALRSMETSLSLSVQFAPRISDGLKTTGTSGGTAAQPSLKTDQSEILRAEGLASPLAE